VSASDVKGALGCLSLVGMHVALWFFIGWAIESTYDREIAQIESLRSDAGQVSADVAEDVIGQVAETNQRIVWNQVTNDYPIVGFFISDRWESVRRIEVPR